MAEEKKYDDETQKFYEDNKEMIDKILSKSKEEGADSEKAYLEEMLRRAAFERRMRMEYESEKARRKAFESADKAYSDYRYGRGRTEEAFDEARDHLREFSGRQGDYLLDLLYDEGDRAREELDRGRRYFDSRYESDIGRIRGARDSARRVFNDGFDDIFGPFCDPRFQKHLVGAGLEMWMALNALIRAGPFPESVKEAFEDADRNRNSEFCRKNEYCEKKPSDSAPKQIKIVPSDKENKQ